MSQTVLEFKDASIFQGDSLVLSNVNVKIDKGDFVYLSFSILWFTHTVF